MFGYPTAFLNGYMVAGLCQEDFFVRLPPERQRRLLAFPGAHHLEPVPGRAMKSYVTMPAVVLEDNRRLLGWMRTAIRTTAKLPPKARGARRPKAASVPSR